MAKITPKGPDPAKVASNVYTKIFENQLIRVFDIRFKPGEKAVMHWHPNHFVYVIEDGKLAITPPKGDMMKVAVKAGDTMWMDSGHHEAVNPGKTDLHALVVEFKGNTRKLSK
jgi:oxalate decarboxylase/phosphoglucose isomerase-like protein (cupin superfamily)